jgi:hypothetical protein
MSRIEVRHVTHEYAAGDRRVAIDSDQLRRPVHARQESRPMTGEAAEWTST